MSRVFNLSSSSARKSVPGTTAGGLMSHDNIWGCGKYNLPLVHLYRCISRVFCSVTPRGVNCEIKSPTDYQAKSLSTDISKSLIITELNTVLTANLN